MVNVNKLSKDEYVKYMINLVDENKIKETWEEFRKKFEIENPKIKCDFWIDFMELDDADLNDLDILGSLDKQVLEFVINNPRIINKEVMTKIDRKVNAKIPDHIQIDIEGYTGVGKSTFMRALCSHFFPSFNIDCVFYLKKDLLEKVTAIEDIDDKKVVVLDEDVLSKGMGSVRVEDDLTQLFESCRKARLSYIGCHAIAKHENQTTFYRFFVFANNKERRISTAIVYRMNVCIGFLVMRIPYTQKFFEMEYEYEQKKNEFIKKTLKNENVETIDVTGCANKVLNDVEMQMLKSRNLLNKKSLKAKVYELYNSYTIGEQDMIVTKAFNLYLMAGNECDDYVNTETK